MNLTIKFIKIQQQNATDATVDSDAMTDTISFKKTIFEVKKSEEWPLKKQATIEILAECPSYDENKSPEFYKRMGYTKDIK